MTKAGERCFAFLKPTEEKYQAIVEECRKEYAEQSKILQVGYQNMLDWGPVLNTAQGALRAEVPGLTLLGELFDSATLCEHLRKRQVDMIIIYERFAPRLDGLVRLEIARMPLLLLVSAKNPKATDTATFRDFAKEPFIEDMFPNEELPETLRRSRKTAAICGWNLPISLWCRTATPPISRRNWGRASSSAPSSAGRENPRTFASIKRKPKSR
jgi:DNA-binding transcriptional LysR family regulator